MGKGSNYIFLIKICELFAYILHNLKKKKRGLISECLGQSNTGLGLILALSSDYSFFMYSFNPVVRQIMH